MTIVFVELQRYLCPVCQADWTGEQSAPCEDCYSIGWNLAMVEACKGQTPPLRAPEGHACAGEDCPNPAPRSGDWCQECEWIVQRRFDREDELRDRAINQEIDRRRGK